MGRRASLLAGALPVCALTAGATAHFWRSGARKDRAIVHAPTLEAIFD